MRSARAVSWAFFRSASISLGITLQTISPVFESVCTEKSFSLKIRFICKYSSERCFFLCTSGLLVIHGVLDGTANTQPCNSSFCSTISPSQSVISTFQFIIASYTLYGILSLYLFAVSLIYCSLYSLYFWNASSGVLKVPSLMFL